LADFLNLRPFWERNSGVEIFMQSKIFELEKTYLKKNPATLKAGDSVKVYQRIQEGGKERVQVFEGIVINCKGGKGVGATFTVRHIGADNIGVEKTFPLHSPTIVKIEKVKEAKVRRAKLFYLRGKTGKHARLKEKKSYKIWEEPEAEVELEKIEKEKGLEVQAKEEEKKKQEEELEKKFEAAQAAHTKEQSEESAGTKGGEDSGQASGTEGVSDSRAKSEK